MALVTSFELNTKERQSVHGPTRYLYAIVEGPNGRRYLQLDTVGSGDRAIPDKVSQSLQFDRQAAGQLIQLLQRAFPDLVATRTGSASAVEPTPPVDVEGIEGHILYRLHRTKERDRRLVKAKKQATIAGTGGLTCEVCDFDFPAVYGQIGEGFAECHHSVALADLDGSTPTRLEDLAIVCANCHRMLHRGSLLTVEQLREIVVSNRTAVPNVGEPK